EDMVVSGADHELALGKLAARLGYSKFHVTRQFARLTGLTLRRYLGIRRIVHSVPDLRDSGLSVLDVAVKHGFSSQESYTRAFRRQFGQTPGEYRRCPGLLLIPPRSRTFDPYFPGLEEDKQMNTSQLHQVSISKITLPAHKLLHIKNPDADNYFSFWRLQETIPGQDCDTITGLLDSIRTKLDSVTGKMGEFDGQIGGWYHTDTGQKGYFYGVRLPLDYIGPLPSQMTVVNVPQGDYLSFVHPAFDWERDWESVYDAVDEATSGYDYLANGLTQNLQGYIYQIVNPERLGYRIYVPLLNK
ncbi:MAG TPA: AraC family transcriptional regulator, partial [Bacillota bacterium]|nr:AraC family transcriptional regulator [Bacillota bacterium]